MPAHRISVIIPTHNRAALIERAVRSVLDQTVPVDEVVIVDDGSTDSTPSVVHALAIQDPRVRLIRQAQAGAPAARNRGLAEVGGDLVAFQDSDDVWAPTFIEKLLALHSRERVVAFASMSTVAVDGTHSIAFPDRIHDVDSTLAGTNCISTQTALVDARLFEGREFDTRLQRLQDWDLWLGMLGEAIFVHTPEPLVTQYLQSDSITSGAANLYRSLRIITRKHWRVMIRRPFRLARLSGAAWTRGWGKQ